MAWYHVIAGSWRGSTKMEQIAVQLAGAQWNRVWERLTDQVWGMSRHERRGYIRARGALVVQEAVEQAVRQQQMQADASAGLYARTMDHVVSRVVDHMSARLPQAQRARRAA